MTSKYNDAFTQGVFEKSHFLADVLVTMFDIDLALYVHRAEDGTIYLVEHFLGKPFITYEIKGTHPHLRDDLPTLLKGWFRSMYFWEGFPSLERSSFFTALEWEAMIQEVLDEFDVVRAETKKRITPIIDYLREMDLRPFPSPFTLHHWTADCPNCGGKHFIMISTVPDDGWGCGYCKKKGNITDLQNWIEEIAIKRKTNYERKHGN